MLNRGRHLRGRGFTLIEMIAAMVVLSIIAAASSGIILGAADGYVAATSQRQSVDRGVLALERIALVLREAAESGTTPGAPGLADVGSTWFERDDGTRVELLGSTLMMTEPAFGQGVLCTDVVTFRLTYFDAGGSELDVGDAQTLERARRVVIALDTGGMEARIVVAPRSGMGWRL